MDTWFEPTQIQEQSPSGFSEPRVVRTEFVIAAVCAEYGLSRDELMGRCRWKRIAQARNVAMYIARKLGCGSYPELGREFGNRDHTTVMSAVRSIDRQMVKDYRLTSIVLHLEKELQG